MFSLAINAQEKQVENFITHKVKKRETLYGLSKKYKTSIEEILKYNSKVRIEGLKKRMRLKIPVYKVIVKSEIDSNFIRHLVKEKETKWRIAKKYTITIEALEILNPQIKEGLKTGQVLKIEKKKEALDYDYYIVQPKEGFYRIEKNTRVSEAKIRKLNPILDSIGLRPGMKLKIPKKIDNNTFDDDLKNVVVNLKTLEKIKDTVNIAIFLPFKLNEIDLDSLQEDASIFEKRNLHTIALDFYSGIQWAFFEANKLGIYINAKVYDTENNTQTIRRIIDNDDFSKIDVIIGPLTPTNFNYLSRQKTIPIVSPLSVNAVLMRPHVFQSVVQEDYIRKRTLNYLEKTLALDHNIIIIGDSIENVSQYNSSRLIEKFPKSHFINITEETVISLDSISAFLVDTIPNKVILETKELKQIYSISSMLNSQNTNEKNIQLFTIYRSPIYQNLSISNEHLGGVNFTFLSGTKTNYAEEPKNFYKKYTQFFGNIPNRESIRGYDVTLDIILRIATKGSLKNTINVGEETKYIENKFYYVPNNKGGYTNQGYYILQHEKFWIKELKKK